MIHHISVVAPALLKPMHCCRCSCVRDVCCVLFAAQIEQHRLCVCAVALLMCGEVELLFSRSGYT